MQPEWLEPQTFDEFLWGLRLGSSGLTLSADKLAAELGITPQEMADLARVHRNTLLAPTSTKLQAALREVVSVLSAAWSVQADMTKVLFWFRNHPIKDLSHRTAMDLVADGKSQAVIGYLQSISSGASG